MKMVGGGARVRKTVGYKFYKKAVSTKFVTPFRSAQALNRKVASLSQDVFGIQANTSKVVTHSEVIDMLDDFCHRLEVSGYPVKIAEKVVCNGIICYERKVRKTKELKEIIHRPENFGKVERRIGKLMRRSN